MQELDLWNLLHDLTLATSTSLPLKATDIKLTHRASTTHLLYPSRVRAWLGSVALISSTLVIQQLDSVMTTNSSDLTLCHSSHSDY